jgi:hypothetical protein
VQIRQPEGIGEVSEEELEELTDVLVNNYGWGGFAISLTSFGDLIFSFLIIRWREMPIVEIDNNNLVHIQL